jgi:hypothetical protein
MFALFVKNKNCQKVILDAHHYFLENILKLKYNMFDNKKYVKIHVSNSECHFLKDKNLKQLKIVEA